jgi:hypothetical protein
MNRPEAAPRPATTVCRARAGRRRGALKLIGTAALARLVQAHAQTGARPARVGVLIFGAPPAPQRPDPQAAFYRALRELGYAEGQNIVF